MHELLHAVWHALTDTLRLAPFLFLTYLAMEALEHKAGERVERWISQSGRIGPLLGALLGLAPQSSTWTILALVILLALFVVMHMILFRSKLSKKKK